jgi:hypothetical protein
MTMRDKILLRKKYQTEFKLHSLTNLVASLIAHSFQNKKPSLKFQTQNNTQLDLFC